MESVPFGPFGAITARARYGTGHQAAIVAPVEAHPGSALERLVLQVSGLVENFVVVDAEHLASSHASERRGADAADLRFEEARRHARHHGIRREAMRVRNADAEGKSGDFRFGPLDGKGDR